MPDDVEQNEHQGGEGVALDQKRAEVALESFEKLVAGLEARGYGIGGQADSVIKELEVLKGKGFVEWFKRFVEIKNQIFDEYNKKNPGFEVDKKLFLSDNFDNIKIFFYKLFYPEAALSSSDIHALFKEDKRGSDWYKEYSMKMVSFMLKAAKTIFSDKQFGVLVQLVVKKDGLKRIGKVFMRFAKISKKFEKVEGVVKDQKRIEGRQEKMSEELGMLESLIDGIEAAGYKLSNEANSILVELEGLKGKGLGEFLERFIEIKNRTIDEYNEENFGFEVGKGEDLLDIYLEVFFYKLFYPERLLSNFKIYTLFKDVEKDSDWYDEYTTKTLNDIIDFYTSFESLKVDGGWHDEYTVMKYLFILKIVKVMLSEERIDDFEKFVNQLLEGIFEALEEVLEEIIRVCVEVFSDAFMEHLMDDPLVLARLRRWYYNESLTLGLQDGVAEEL